MQTTDEMLESKLLYNCKVGFYQSKDNDEELEFVYPNPKPEESTIKLGRFDKYQPDVWVPVTVVIDNREGKVTYNILKTGLELALGHYPWFAGTLEEDSYKFGNAWFGKANSNSDFNIDNIDDNFNVLPYEFQFKKAIDSILNSTSKTAPLFAAKATFVRDNCVVLTTLTSHTAADGETIAEFLRFWAESTCNPVKASWKPIIKPDPVEGDVLKLVVDSSTTTSLSALSVKISLKKLEAIQNEINKFTNISVSKEDIFIALLWRIQTRIRGTKDNITLLRAMSIRSSEEYNLGLGNKYINIFSSLDTPDVLVSKPIEEIAQLIRSSLPYKGTKLSSDLIAMSETSLHKVHHGLCLTSHRMMYQKPMAFCHQFSKVHIHLLALHTFVIQPTDGKTMFATTCMSNDLVRKYLIDDEVISYGLDITVNNIN